MWLTSHFKVSQGKETGSEAKGFSHKTWEVKNKTVTGTSRKWTFVRRQEVAETGNNSKSAKLHGLPSKRVGVEKRDQELLS